MINYKFRNIGKITLKRLFCWAATFIILLLFALFMNWLLLNSMLRCCDGGVCFPDLYPACRNINYDQIYGEGYYDAYRTTAK